MDRMHLTPIWEPSLQELQYSNIALTLKKLNFQNYSEFYRFSIEHRDDFWDYTIKNLGIAFQKPYSAVLDRSNPDYQQNPHWLVDAKMNIVESCFQASPHHTAIILGDENQTIKKISYGELKTQVQTIAYKLQQENLKPGEVIGLAMPMNINAIATYLAIIYAGYTVCAIAESFAPDEIATRLRISQAKLVITQDFFIRQHKKIDLYSKIQQATDLPTLVWCYSQDENPSLRKQDRFFHSETLNLKTTSSKSLNFQINDNDSDVTHEHLEISAEHTPQQCNSSEKLNDKNINSSHFLTQAYATSPETPITILFSSGTTGDPKAIPWTHITPIKSASDAYYHLNLKPEKRFAWPTSLGWMMGPFLVFASLINKATLMLFEGVPTDYAFAKFIETQKVTHLGLVPSLVKSWRTTSFFKKQCSFAKTHPSLTEKNPDTQTEIVDWSGIELFASTGECSNAEDMAWLSTIADHKPVIEYCGGTEIGGGYITGTVMDGFIPGTFTTPALGIDFVLLDENQCIANQGEVALIPPSIGLSTTLLNRDHNHVYFKDMPKLSDGTLLRRHGDEIIKLDNGYFQALGRVDDTMNLGGIKVSSAEIERTLNQSELYQETAAIAVTPLGGGPSSLVIYVVPLHHTVLDKNELQIAMQKLIREKLNPLFKIHDIVAIEALPRTASNKIMRRTLREHYCNANQK